MSYADPYEDFEQNDPAKLLPYSKELYPQAAIVAIQGRDTVEGV